jgi:hypothetical protein
VSVRQPGWLPDLIADAVGLHAAIDAFDPSRQLERGVIGLLALVFQVRQNPTSCDVKDGQDVEVSVLI